MEWDELLHLAVVKCGLSHKKFWKLSWFEFRLYMDRYVSKLESEKLEFERSWEQTRSLWVAIMNAHYKKKGGGKYEGGDLIKLSYDKKPVSEKPSLELFEKLVQKHGKRKKKDGK